ncbi:MAG: cell division FtsA domain-containing protein [Bacilli bacterium]|jgi:cell division protein FtsA
MEENTVAALEITSSCLKLVLGYQHQGKVVVLYAIARPIDGLIDGGNIIDLPKLSEEIKELSHIKDSTAKLKIVIGEVILIVPPLGLEVYKNDKTTTVVSPTGMIANIDVTNVLSLVKKEQVPQIGNEIVDIIPEKFTLDKGRSFLNPPINEQSAFLSVHASIYSLPSRIVNDYRNAVQSAGLHVRRVVVSSYGVSELFCTYENIPSAYLYVDYGDSITSVSLISKSVVFGSSYFLLGGKQISNALMNQFNIPFIDAEKLKRKIGLDKRELSYVPVLLTSVDIRGKNCNYSIKDVNAVIEKQLDDFSKSLDNCIKNVLSDYDISYRDMPIVLGGGSSRLRGLKEYLREKFTLTKDIINVVPTSIGARNESFTNCLGAIYAQSKRRGSLEDEKSIVTPVSRDDLTIKNENSGGLSRDEL